MKPELKTKLNDQIEKLASQETPFRRLKEAPKMVSEWTPEQLYQEFQMVQNKTSKRTRSQRIFIENFVKRLIK